MAYDAARQDVVLFGGQTMDGFLGGTFIWRDHRWTQVFPRHSPSPRAYASIAYDPVHRDVVLFGGLDDTGKPADTWLWNGDDWTRAAPSFSPPGTVEAGMTFFAGTGTVLLYIADAMGTGPSGHVYSWDGANWKDLPFTFGPPSTRAVGGWSVDPAVPTSILVMPDVRRPMLQQWEFDGRTWTERGIPTPPARDLVEIVTDDRNHTVILFGGPNGGLNGGLNDTWTWDGTRWTHRHPGHAPSVRSSTGPMPAIAYDGAGHEVVLFGGIDPHTNAPLNDTWTWDGKDWHRI